MFALVAVLWIIYLSECFVRWTPGCWVFRPGSPGPFEGVSDPDITFFSGRVGFVRTSILPWRLAYRFPPPHDPLIRAQAQIQRVRRGSVVLRIFATVLFSLVMLVFPALLWMEYFVPLLPVFALTVAIVWASTLTTYLLTHRSIFGHMPAMESWVMATLSPLTLMRAPALISIDSSSSTHPAFAADALCGDEAFLRLARLWHYDVPELRKDLDRLAAKRGHVNGLTSPPADSEDDVSVYCPRCHETYLLGAMTCADCVEVPLQPLPNARRIAAGIAAPAGT